MLGASAECAMQKITAEGAGPLQTIGRAATPVARNPSWLEETAEMKIISVRRGFTSDHSSTSYEFVAIDKPLDDEAQDSIASLSSRAEPTDRTVEFVYNVEGYDIPGGWEPLMRDYYDVMYSNDYDWVTLAMAFNAPKEKQDEIAKYEFDDGDNLRVSVSTFDLRIIVAIHCMLDPGAHYELTGTRRKCASCGEPRFAGYLPRDPLLNLLTRVRKERPIIRGEDVERGFYATA